MTEKKSAKTDRKVALLFLGAAAAILLVVLFVRASLPRRESFIDPATGLPQFQRLLPADEQTADDSFVALPDAVRPAYVVGYSSGSQSGVALITWDEARGIYWSVANRTFATGVSGAAAKPPSLSVINVGQGASSAVQVRAAMGPETSGSFFVARQENDLQFVNMRDASGKVRPALFVSGTVPNESVGGDKAGQNGAAYAATSDFRLEDVNNDGNAEAVVRSRSFKGGWSTSVDVYVWRDGLFDYDKELSRIMTTGATLFPEPGKRPQAGS